MFQHALVLHRQGKLDEAARSYEAVLAAEPAHVDALVHFGVLRLGQGCLAEAEALLRRAVALAPSSPVALANLAAALQAAGRYEAAVSHYEHALKIKPNMVDAQLGLATCLQEAGRHAAAIACYEAILAGDPEHPEANFGLASLLVKLDRADEAIARYRAALDADADFAEANHGLGTLLARRGEFEAAIGCFLEALDVDPSYIEAQLALGLALQRLERDDESMVAWRAALKVEPDNAIAHHGLATILCRKHQYAEAIRHFQMALARAPERVDAMAGMAEALVATGRHAEAIALCRAAIAVQPDFAAAMSVLGLALAEIGDMEQAETASRRAVALAPNSPEFCFNLTQITKVRRGDQVLDALEAILPGAAFLSPREQCALHFGLAKVYDDIGEQDRAFSHLLEGNAIKRRLIAYDEASALRTMDRIREVFTTELIAARRNLGDSSTIPVFIVGMPRSGTTLVEQVLASHPAVFGAGERRELLEAAQRLRGRVGAVPFPEAVWTIAGEELRRIGAAYVAALQPLAPDAERITDKMPINFQLAGLIHLVLPNARTIHVMRDPVDTCLSCFSRLFSGDQLFAYDLGELGRFYRGYRRLMAHWRQVLPSDTLLEVQYERLVEDFATEARRILAHCQLPWDDACLEFHKTSRPVQTASVAQVRQPLYRSSIGRWRPDPAQLRPLLEALGADSRRSDA
jgi:tetratricopeptide (TPR) repeat protein